MKCIPPLASSQTYSSCGFSCLPGCYFLLLLCCSPPSPPSVPEPALPGRALGERLSWLLHPPCPQKAAGCLSPVQRSKYHYLGPEDWLCHLTLILFKVSLSPRLPAPLPSASPPLLPQGQLETAPPHSQVHWTVCHLRQLSRHSGTCKLFHVSSVLPPENPADSGPQPFHPSSLPPPIFITWDLGCWDRLSSPVSYDPDCS